MIRRKLLVIGCGFLGLSIARRFHELEWDVLGLTHSTESALKLGDEGFPIVPCDVADPVSVERLATARGKRFDVIIHCASSGRGGPDGYRQVYYIGMRNVCQSLRCDQLIFTSSTSVYAQVSGAWVTEESSADPQKDTGVILRDAEEFVLSKDGVVLRLSALYGPGRSVLLKKFFDGEAVIEGDGYRWINQIHRDDAVLAMEKIVNEQTFGIYNVSDDYPIPQVTLYQLLAQRFERPLPPYGPVNLNKRRGFTNKRVANTKLRGLGWRPQYASFFEAIERDPWIALAARPEDIA